MSLSTTEKIKNWFRDHVRIPLGVTIAICIFPVLLTAFFYALRSSKESMDWVVTYISAPIRSFLGFLSSIYPFALMEVLCTVAVIFLVYYIVKSIRDTSRRREKWKLLGKRLLPILVVACYIWGLFCWLWSSGYHATGFAERYKFSSEGVAQEDLIIVTQYFAHKANELSEEMERDSDGKYIADRRLMFDDSTTIFWNISYEFPSLRGRVDAPKPMLYSWLMSITRYSGMYFALTGEVMINTQPPGVYMPFTVAHEHAHQRGIFAEDEANFVGVAACVSSDNPVFEYAGYMAGLNYLLNVVPVDELFEILDNMTYHVRLDRFDESIFWATRTQSNTGINFLDRFLTTVAETTNEAVNTIYDSFLKSQNQELGLQSYGACVDLLVEYFLEEAIAYIAMINSVSDDEDIDGE